MLMPQPIGAEPKAPRPTSPLGLAQWIERAALADTYRAAEGHGPERLGAWVVRRGAAVAYGAQAIASPAFNRVFLGGEEVPLRAADADAVLAALRDRGKSELFVHLSSREHTPAVAAVLSQHGLAPYRRAWVKLMREPGAVPRCPTALTIRRARDGDAEAVSELVIIAHGLRPETRALVSPLIGRSQWHGYVACAGSRVVAFGMLLVRDDIGYLSMAATDPAYRRQGAQSALLEKRLRVAFALGCRRVFAETGVAVPGEANPSYENMCRLGLVPIGGRENFAAPGVRWG